MNKYFISFQDKHHSFGRCIIETENDLRTIAGLRKVEDKLVDDFKEELKLENPLIIYWKELK